jgi:hypothetical protein
MFSNFFPENRAVYEIMWKNLIYPDRSRITVQYGAEKTRFAFRITKGRIQTDCYVSTAPLITWMCLIGTSYVHYISSLMLKWVIHLTSNVLVTN